MDGDIDFSEFVNYCLENEKKLHILFKDIDLNADGKIDSSELVHAFERAGIEVDNQEVLKLVNRIKEKNNIKDGEAVELDFAEFRDYLLLHPTDSLHDLMRSWRHGTVWHFDNLNSSGLTYIFFFSLWTWAKMALCRWTLVRMRLEQECGGVIYLLVVLQEQCREQLPLLWIV